MHTSVPQRPMSVLRTLSSSQPIVSCPSTVINVSPGLSEPSRSAEPRFWTEFMTQ